MEKDEKKQQHIMDWNELLLYLGYDIYNEKDIDRLVRNCDWVENQRKKDENRKSIRPSIVVTIITIIISSIVTIATTWESWIPKK